MFFLLFIFLLLFEFFLFIIFLLLKLFIPPLLNSISTLSIHHNVAFFLFIMKTSIIMLVLYTS